MNLVLKIFLKIIKHQNGMLKQYSLFKQKNMIKYNKYYTNFNFGKTVREIPYQFNKKFFMYMKFPKINFKNLKIKG